MQQRPQRAHVQAHAQRGRAPVPARAQPQPHPQPPARVRFSSRALSDGSESQSLESSDSREHQQTVNDQDYSHNGSSTRSPDSSESFIDCLDLDPEDRRFLRTAKTEYQSAHFAHPSAMSRAPPRQSVRNGIVQQWDPAATTTARSDNASRRNQLTTADLDPEDDADFSQGTLARLIEQQVEENGIERPKGYNVSFHYNRQVENMHFGRTHPMKPWRLTLTKHLVLGYGLQFAMDNYESMPASKETVAEFHDPEYVDFLTEVSPQTFERLHEKYPHRIPPGSVEDSVRLGPFNLSTSPGADCPVFDGMSEYLFTYTGATMEAARCLTNHQSDIALNWSGGLHHAHKAEASGFCYINDIVLAILEMLRFFSRVLYIDIDVHHGDGVEEAFNSTDRVMTISLHRYGLVDASPPHMFFPGTGSHTDNGNPNSVGHHFALNVPILPGIGDDDYLSLFKRVIGRANEAFRPAAIVLQCGADSLGGDRLGQFNLNIKAHGECLAFVKSLRVPLLVLGGGGYTARNVARAWCHETALAVGAELDDNLPMHILPRPRAFMTRKNGDGKLYPDLKGFHNNECTKKDLEDAVLWCMQELKIVEKSPSANMDRLPPKEAAERVRRRVDEEWDRERENERGENTRKRRERNAGGRGELR